LGKSVIDMGLDWRGVAGTSWSCKGDLTGNCKNPQNGQEIKEQHK